MTDGRIINLESSIEKFHELRFNVARVLREMQVLNKRFNPDLNDDDLLKIKKEYNIMNVNRLAKVNGINNLKQLIKDDNDDEIKKDQ